MGGSTPDEAEPEAGPEAEPAAGPAEEPAAEPVERPAVEPGLPAAEPTAKPVAEPAAGHAAGSAEEPAVEPKLAAAPLGPGQGGEVTTANMAVARRLGDPREAGGLPSVGGSTRQGSLHNVSFGTRSLLRGLRWPHGGSFSVLIAGGGCTGVALVGFSGIRLCRKNGTKSRPPVKAARVSAWRRGNSGNGHHTCPVRP